MHEMSIASSLMQQLERIAAEQHLTRITGIEVRCGVMRQVVPEALRLAFEVLSADTVAAGAGLKIIEEPVTARCRQCAGEYAAEIDDYRCPRCGQANVEIVAGRDIVLQTITGEMAEEGART